MTINTLTDTSAPLPAMRLWSLPALLLRRLRDNRRELVRMSLRARQARIRCGYRHVPTRVWDRRSALFIEER